VNRAIQAEAKADGFDGDAGSGLGGMFNDPQLFAKLAANPQTSALLADQEFMGKLRKVQQNPNLVGEEMRDPRFLQVMSVLLGIDMRFGDPGEAAKASAGQTEQETDVPMGNTPPSYSATPEASKPKEDKPAEPEVVEEDEEAAEKKKAKEAADKEKLLGTENYKKRQFDAAIEHYSKAWELYKDITYLTNLSAAKFEKGDYDGCIEECKKAISEGREILADFKVIAK
jgi:stress-induced-phosphoprotein 1